MKEIMNGTWEDSRRHPKSWEARGRQVGPAGPTITPVGAPLYDFGPLFWKLPPPPLLMHLNTWLGQFDHTAHAHPTRQ